MSMPKPSPGHLLLEKLAGSWVGEEIMHPSQWDPKGGEAIGRNNHKLSLGGFDGDVLTLAHGGPGMHARMTYDFSTPETMKGMMEMSPDGQAWKVLFEATYKRV